MHRGAWIIAIIACALCGASQAAMKVWAKEDLAKVSAGLDAKGSRTYVSTIALIATGPDTVQNVAEKVVSDCIGLAIGAAKAAFSANPDASNSTRVAGAVAAFKATMITCFQASAVEKSVAEQFDLGLVSYGQWEPGIHVELTLDNPQAAYYSELRSFMKDRVPEPVFKMVNLYADVMAPVHSLSASVQVPDWLANAVAQTPTVQAMTKFVDELKRHMPADANISTDAMKDFQGYISDKTDEFKKKLQKPELSEDEIRQQFEQIWKPVPSLGVRHFDPAHPFDHGGPPIMAPAFDVMAKVPVSIADLGKASQGTMSDAARYLQFAKDMTASRALDLAAEYKKSAEMAAHVTDLGTMQDLSQALPRMALVAAKARDHAQLVAVTTTNFLTAAGAGLPQPLRQALEAIPVALNGIVGSCDQIFREGGQLRETLQTNLQSAIDKAKHPDVPVQIDDGCVTVCAGGWYWGQCVGRTRVCP
jgi:hypothetical protein